MVSVKLFKPFSALGLTSAFFHYLHSSASAERLQ